MLKEVGTSGQISLGKRFAGQLFDVQLLDTGAVHMLPVRVVPMIAPANQEKQGNANSAQEDQWHLVHAKQIAAYSTYSELRQPFAESVREWREEQNKAAASSGAAFHEQFGAWVNEMNQMVEQHGVWSDGLMEAEQPHGAV